MYMTAHALSPTEFANRLLEHIVDPLIALMAFIALLFFIITAARIIYNTDSYDRSKIMTQLWWSIFGIFIIFSVWTILTFVGRLANSDISPEGRELEFGEYNILL